MAFDHMKRAEVPANECQVELDKIRVENSELDRFIHIKELNVHIVDFETKSYGTPPRPSSNTQHLESRIEELTNQLNQVTKDKGGCNSRRIWLREIRSLSWRRVIANGQGSNPLPSLRFRSSFSIHSLTHQHIRINIICSLYISNVSRSAPLVCTLYHNHHTSSITMFT